MIDTSDFPQADDIQKVIKVPYAVHNGHHSDDAIEQFIDTHSKGRQGRYYRLAAEKLGLVILSGKNHTVLTPAGLNFVNQTPSQQKQNLVSAIRTLPVFSDAIKFIDDNKPTPDELRKWLIEFYPGEHSTAGRRFSTLVNYLRYCGYRY